MDTLVLDVGYAPVARITWQRAIMLFFDGKVEIVDSYEDRSIRSVTFEIKMPSIVRFLKSIKFKRKGLRFSRENVYMRDHGKCQYCGKNVPRNEFTYDHVKPRAQGGQTTWENVVVACVPCNQVKAGRTPEQAGMRLNKKPSKPDKLAPTFKMTFTWQKGMPLSWKDFLSSVSYWHSELENDNS